MAARISIMVLPSRPPELPPQILLEQNGVWQDMMPYDQTTNIWDIFALKKNIDGEFNKIMGEVENGEPHRAGNISLYGPFEGFYKKLVTKKVRDVLIEAASRNGDDLPELLIHSHTYVEWLPWEMFHDGTDFLGLRFRVARLPIMTQIPDMSAKSITVSRIYNLLANNFLDGPQKLVWESTFKDIIPAGLEMTKSPPPYPNVDDIVNARDADILHITCHGGLRDKDDKDGKDSNVYWTLDSSSAMPTNYQLRATTFFESESVRYSAKPLVFGNACASTNGGTDRQNGLIPGYGASFFAKGALNFVGTFAPITKDLAIEFARIFYQKLLGTGGKPPLPIAQALWETKNHYRSPAINSPDPSYLFYCLYGPPDTVFQAVPPPGP
jgi:hypothetical protein